MRRAASIACAPDWRSPRYHDAPQGTRAGIGQLRRNSCGVRAVAHYPPSPVLAVTTAEDVSQSADDAALDFVKTRSRLGSAMATEQGTHVVRAATVNSKASRARSCCVCSGVSWSARFAISVMLILSNNRPYASRAQHHHCFSHTGRYVSETPGIGDCQRSLTGCPRSTRNQHQVDVFRVRQFQTRHGRHTGS